MDNPIYNPSQLVTFTPVDVSSLNWVRIYDGQENLLREVYAKRREFALDPRSVQREYFKNKELLDCLDDD